MILTGGTQVEQNFHEITVEQLCKVINLLHPCMDDYLYVYDFINDFYYISPHAKQRFCIPDMIGCINEIGAAQKADNVSGLLGSSSLQTYMDTVPVPFPDGYLLHLGLDDFKEINEKLGIEYGDTVLRQTAECISKCISPSQKLYRTVADEFLILDLQGGSRKDAKALYRAIQREIIHFVEECRYEAVFTISGGILESSKIKDYSFYDVMKLSEFSLNEAKRQGKNRCYCFCQEDYESFLKRKKLTQFLRQAVYQDCKGFEAYFQPLFHARTNTLYGAETLMRFHSPEGSMVSPVEFIPILEETGLIIALDDFGTGYSNFHYLHDLRPDIIKIDRSFTAKALANEYEYNLLDLISKMVHTLNLNVCVEGIETSNERNQIQNLAPDYIQGFYFGKPCPYQQFTENYIK